MDSLQHWQISDVLCIEVPEIINEGGKWKCPFVRTDGDKERWKAKVADCVDEVQMLMLPKCARKSLVLEATIWRTTSSLGRIDSTSDGFEEPPVVVILQHIEAEGIIHDG